ncbi:UDP-3-O-(3-hydroxymyristoyl)glucosamine N-acyltransferase [Tenacibaculum finnmarkense]|uniref:UDP-3-O-(3-hydroxymyristoyl)glucosamine N-acyltransferase n=1 Tax=Tenacibaculum finnmarkense TaxID=2781243 RepID=UPI001EFB3793|nr:UDP-3-O-(3-hydroxymyristoyl)glucosamine N-acyltransferase [Tenacibaculum finnmarkense]MCG8750292.1 UDP-3-O-(3-hydroxymyristoyl)glucosamine N-acyltransferase [Tenacibaculum finnmarkense]MCG8755415.1 UDP-3-O-(3-hydroxymyristoyl)glucosamine N-acyltransferase [Tenacibaculum finnmarkense]MCG8783920.1 UDP-3-O-(3-hydroxymyristoyl)glucosamine N-acyltransferase [Tenacibaculum finnmarkense]
MKPFTVQEINSLLKGELLGNCSEKITAPQQIEKAQKGQITFIGNKKFAKLWENSNASAAIICEKLEMQPQENKAFIKVKNPDLAMAMLLEAFEPASPYFETDIHPTAVIDKTATIGEGCKIGANCYIGKNVVLSEGIILYPNVTIFDDTTIGKNTVIWSGTVVRERSIIGNDCIFHSNVSIGADGFGYRPSVQGLTKIPHIGNVIIGNQVEIGANSCVDRGKFSATILGDGCKIDNLVQIGHNCVLGKFCIMAGSSGLAGSVTLGDGVIIGGSASIKDHVTIHSGATVGAGSGVITDVPAGKTVLGYPATDAREKMKQWVALRKLGRQ